MHNNPLVTVLMPVYNGESHLHTSVESILVQSFENFEFLILDDGSTDATKPILADYVSKDRRIEVIQNEGNIGLSRSLNRGLALARGKYIARMDADDISLPERLQKQVEYMESHPEVGVLGTNIVYIDDDGNFKAGGRPKDKRPESPKVIEWLLLWRCCIYHPTVMMRRAVLEDTGFIYDPAFEPSEDRDLWIRLNKHTAIAKLPQVLLHYRISAGSVSRTRAEEQRKMRALLTRRELTILLEEQLSERSVMVISNSSYENDQYPLSVEDFVGAADLLIGAYQRFCDRPLSKTDKAQIKADVAGRLALIAVQAYYR